MKIFLPVIILISAILYTGCETRPDLDSEIQVVSLDSEEIEKIRQEKFDLKLSAEYHDSLFIEQVPAVDIDSKGQVYVAGERHQIRSVYVYSPEGELLDTLGRYGDGPGEFESIFNIQIVDNSLYVFDDQLRRVTQFDLSDQTIKDVVEFDESIVRELEDSVEFFPTPIENWDEGRYLIEYKDDQNPALHSDRIQFYSLGDENGNISDKDLFELKSENYLVGDHAGRPTAFLLPYPERSLITSIENRKFYTAWSEQFEIQERDTSGSAVKILTYPYQRSPLDSEKLVSEQYSHNRQLQLTRESAEYPSEWPAIYTILQDDSGQIWVALIPEDESSYEWWILDPSKTENVVHAIFSWPRKSLFAKISNGSVYAVEPDDDGFRKIVRYTIDSD